jgi:hypothetical protein
MSDLASGGLVVREWAGERSYAIRTRSGHRLHSIVLGRERDGWNEAAARRVLAGFCAERCRVAARFARAAKRLGGR